ncbi:MAG: hypothetical protein HYY17_02265 [Planctomycetes bacterium]|nr:hypothetical protein [Planctomycetota bacterium]
MILDSYTAMVPLRALAALLPRPVALALAPHPWARFLVDFMYLPRWRPEWVRIEGALPPPPFVIVGVHQGHWEMAAAALAHRVPLTVLVRGHDDARLLRFREATRARFGIETLVAPACGRLLAALRRGRAVAMLVDRDGRAPHTAAVLARRAGCPLLAGAVRDGPRGRYTLRIDPPCDEIGLRKRIETQGRAP